MSPYSIMFFKSSLKTISNLIFRTLRRQTCDPWDGVNARTGGGHGDVVPCDAGLWRWAVKIVVQDNVIYFRT